MEKNILVLSLTVGICAWFFLPADLLATTTNDVTTQDFVKEVDKVKNFLFGTMMRIVGVIFGAYCVLQAVLTSSIRPLIIFFMIGSAITLIPKFIEAINSLGALRPW